MEGIGSIIHDPNILHSGEGKDPRVEKLKKAVQGFEAIFIHEIFKVMRRTVMKGGLFDGGIREDIYTTMMDMELSKKISQGGGIGLSRILFEEFLPHVKGGGSADGNGTDRQK